jgi:hypothetical protein
MDLRAFALSGDKGEIVAYRTYALCLSCRQWAEF